MRGDIMNKQEIKGKGQKISGDIQEKVGRATHNRKREIKGKIEKAKGEFNDEVGKARRKSEE